MKCGSLRQVATYAAARSQGLVPTTVCGWKLAAPAAAKLSTSAAQAASSRCAHAGFLPVRVSHRGFAAAAELPPFTELPMPSLSPTMTQGNVSEWKKNEGDKINPGDVLADIETDKATMEMESMEEGYLAKILMPAGSQEVEVGTPVAVLVEDESHIAAFANYLPSAAPAAAPSPAAPAPAPSAPAAPAAPAKALPTPVKPAGARIIASPLAKKLALDYGVNLSGVAGTGPEGRIIKADVEQAKLNPPVVAAAAPAAAEWPTWLFPDYTDMPVKQIQKITAQRLTESKQNIPHYYLSVDVEMDKLMSVRTQLNGVLESDKGGKLSVTDFIVKASAAALMKVPAMNASWMESKIRMYHAADISIAVQTEHGLMVPIVKDADSKGLAAISGDIKDLAKKARENKLSPAEFTGGTFTISNLGMFGVKQFCAIVNPPQAAILAVGGSQKRVVPGKEPGTYKEAAFMCATLSCDHRVVDGAVAAQWLAEFKKAMEDPMTMLL